MIHKKTIIILITYQKIMNQVEMNTIKKVVLKEKPKTKKSIDKKLR